MSIEDERRHRRRAWAGEALGRTKRLPPHEEYCLITQAEVDRHRARSIAAAAAFAAWQTATMAAAKEQGLLKEDAADTEGEPVQDDRSVVEGSD